MSSSIFATDMVQIGFLGPEGTHSEAAGKILAKSIPRARLVPLPAVRDVLLAVEKGKFPYGIVPIENSLEGAIGVTADFLAASRRIQVCQEIVLRIAHALLAAQPCRLGLITDIFSHPQALEQCRKFLARACPRAQLHQTSSTALAARVIVEEEDLYTHPAAIGNAAIAPALGLKVLRKHIEDHALNSTRFYAISRKDHPRTGFDKTTIIFTLEKDRPGGLAGILQEFSSRNINLTRIESRPKKTGLGEYFFFVDCEGHRENPPVRDALKAVRRKVLTLTVLGSYPRARE